MAHFARIDNLGIVQHVVVVNDDDCGGGNFPQSEPIGNAFLNSVGLEGEWKQTSYNGKFRKRYAGTGFKYDPASDVFISPKPFDSWLLDSNFDWQPPIPPPSDGNPYQWDESNKQWVLVE